MCGKKLVHTDLIPEVRALSVWQNWYTLTLFLREESLLRGRISTRCPYTRGKDIKCMAELVNAALLPEVESPKCVSELTHAPLYLS